MKETPWVVDAFTTTPFRGNPAAVCLLDAFPGDEAMQLTALQMQLSETAFVVEIAPLTYQLRWFTPETEVKLCGHATLAVTHVLRQTGLITQGDTVTYHTLSGELPARATDTGIELIFPALPGESTQAHAALEALGVVFSNCQRNRDKYLVEIKDYETLLACKPDFKRLRKLNAQGVIVTTATGIPTGFDFASRYFAPNIGINEDPVTGAAHCFLAPYWAKKLDKTSFHAYQASKGQGILDVTLKGDSVIIAGQCVTTLKGSLPPSRNVSKESKKRRRMA